MATPISDKVQFKIKIIIRDKEEYYMVIKGSNLEEDITIANIYVPNKYICTQYICTQFIRQILTAIKWKIDSNTIIVGDFNIPLSSMDTSSSQKVNKETQALNNTLD